MKGETKKASDGMEPSDALWSCRESTYLIKHRPVLGYKTGLFLTPELLTFYLQEFTEF